MKNILIDDVSLRIRAKNCNLSFKDKLSIAKSLSELYVDVIELASYDKADEVLIKTVCSLVKNSTISCIAGNTESEIDKNYSLISSANNKRLVVSIPVSPTQMEYSACKKPAAILETLSNLVKKSSSLCDTEVDFVDATRAEPKFLYNSIETAINCGAKFICINDISGNMLPDEFYNFVKDLYVNVKELKNVKLSLSINDDYSFGISSFIKCVSLGVDCIKVSLLGGTNLPNAQKVFSTIDNFGSKLNISTKINKTAVKRISDGILGLSIQDKTTYKEENNAKNLDENISKKELSSIVKKLGYDLSINDLDNVYDEYKRLSVKKAVNTKELEVIIATSSMQVPSTFNLVSYSVNSSNLLTSTASIVVKKGEKEISGLSYGNGSVDAAFLAIEGICGKHYELDDYQLGAVTEGKEAIGQAIVRLRYEGKVYSGRGVSTDIVGASIRAYLSALNKIVYEEEN